MSNSVVEKLVADFVLDVTHRLRRPVGSVAARELQSTLSALLDLAQRRVPVEAQRDVHQYVRDLAGVAAVMAEDPLTRKVTITGGHLGYDTPQGRRELDLARDTAARLAEAGFHIVHGNRAGTDVAVAEGATRFGGSYRIGVEQRGPDAVRMPVGERAIDVRTAEGQKEALGRTVHGIVVTPGGFGTKDRFYGWLTEMQTGKVPPVYMAWLEPSGGTYFEKEVAYWRDHFLPRGTISREDLNLMELVQRPEDVAAGMAKMFLNYRTVRFRTLPSGAKELTYLTNVQPTAADVARLNLELPDFALPGYRFEALPVTASSAPGIKVVAKPREMRNLRVVANLLSDLDSVYAALEERGISRDDSQSLVHLAARTDAWIPTAAQRRPALTGPEQSEVAAATSTLMRKASYRMVLPTEVRETLAEGIEKVVGMTFAGAQTGRHRHIRTYGRETVLVHETGERVGEARSISVFGSARLSKQDPLYADIERRVGILAHFGYKIKTGGGPGVMEAASEAARRYGTGPILIKIDLAFEPPTPGIPDVTTFDLFSPRKLGLRDADIVAVEEGGLGTDDEWYESVNAILAGDTQLMVCFEPVDQRYFTAKKALLQDQLLDSGRLARASDLDVFKIARDDRAWLSAIAGQHRNFHSREVMHTPRGDVFLLRSNVRVRPEELEGLQATFGAQIVGRFGLKTVVDQRLGTVHDEISFLPRNRSVVTPIKDAMNVFPSVSEAHRKMGIITLEQELMLGARRDSYRHLEVELLGFAPDVREVASSQLGLAADGGLGIGLAAG